MRFTAETDRHRFEAINVITWVICANVTKITGSPCSSFLIHPIKTFCTLQCYSQKLWVLMVLLDMHPSNCQCFFKIYIFIIDSAECKESFLSSGKFFFLSSYLNFTKNRIIVMDLLLVGFFSLSLSPGNLTIMYFIILFTLILWCYYYAAN